MPASAEPDLALSDFLPDIAMNNPAVTTTGLLLRRTASQTDATLPTATVENPTTALGLHAVAKAMHAGAALVMRLIGPFHRSTPECEEAGGKPPTEKACLHYQRSMGVSRRCADLPRALKPPSLRPFHRAEPTSSEILGRIPALLARAPQDRIFQDPIQRKECEGNAHDINSLHVTSRRLGLTPLRVPLQTFFGDPP